MGKSSKLLLAGTAGLAALTIGFAALRLSSKEEAHLTVMNQSDDDITVISVRVSGQVFELGSLTHKENKDARVVHYSDSHWTIEGAWSDGEKIHEEVGYITSGMNSEDRAIFGKDRKLRFASTPK